ncbi:hypothetical protein GE061_019644 [Apolygus lucorum]|uniref:Ribosomal RNA-processing protein 12-like conserved domain-containing protein n=1 Tax=Apolygus lucorum TaxID=248454 RepID=A0A8S9XAY6_APOLU|nr:hypothetical protein GE061_019644 [Apolygus lucorum]
MAKFRTRVKGANKVKKWAKGHSSDSNPSTYKYRENAKSRFFQPLPVGPSKESNLTMKAVELFNQSSSSKSRDDEMDEDQVSFGGTTTTCKTFDTFASDWSACSNQSFSRLITKFRADSATHKDMLAVLAAVTEVIKQNGGTESSTEYFGALLTALMSEDYNDDQVTAIVNLLAMGIKSVPKAVLQSKFSESSSILMNLLNKYSSTERGSLLRSILGCLSVLLRAQDAQTWSDSSTLQVLRAILAFVSFSKPKIRKAAQHSICAIVQQSEGTHAGHAEIASHCTQLVETVCTSGGVTTTLHILSLLKDIIHSFPKKHLKTCCEAILKIMTLNNVLITSCSMQALNGLFLKASSDQLPSQLAAKLVNALYDYQPPPTDSQPIQAWVTLMQQAHVNLAKSDLRLCTLNLPRLYKTLTDFYLSDRMDTSASVTLALQTVTSECLPLVASSLQSSSLNSQISEIIDIHHSLLSYQYFKSFNLVLHLITALFKALGEHYQSLLVPIVKTLAEFRESNQALFPNDIDNAVGAAIRSLGPEVIIKALPLLINDPSHEFKRSWILPLLKENVKKSTLKCFIDSFLPLTTICKNESNKYKSMNNQIKALSFDLLQSQIWALLPSFADQPKDITATFPSIAKALGGVLNARSDLRLIVLSCLRLLIGFSIDGNNEEDKNTLARFSKNFLPILFNIFTTQVTRSDEEGVRLASLETIKVYLKLAQPDLCEDLFQRALSKFNSEEADRFMKECSLDLLRALTPFQSLANIQQLYNLIVSHINQSLMQKKYYKLLQEILTAESESCKNFVDLHVEEIKAVVLQSFSTANPSSKGARLRCIAQLLNRPENSLSLVDAILPEAILSLKDINGKTKETAHKILATLFQKLPVEEIVTPLLGGLMGTTSMISCSILALASMVYHCKNNLSPEIEQKILHNIGVLALSTTREVVSATMSFIKVYVTSQPREKVGMFVPQIIRIFSAMDEDCKKNNRNRTRDILARLIRWYGAEMVLPLIPPSDEVLTIRAKNLAKIHGRKQRKRASERASQVTGQTGVTTFSVANHHKTIEEILAESDDDLDVEEEVPTDKRKSKKSKTWITEGGDDIIDFTDSRLASRNITGTKPIPRAEGSEGFKTKTTKMDFTTAPDGRLIILGDDNNDGSDDEAPIKKKKKSVLPGVNIPSQDSDSDDFSDEEDDWMTTGGETAITNKKRARSISSAGSSAPFSKYQAGGKGIHRPIAQGVRKQNKKVAKNPYSQTGEEYQSKKARGDIKRKGKPDPFAYLPLRRDALNKRKRMKAIGNLKNVLNAAKKGAVIGTKKKMSKNIKMKK